MYKRSIKIYAYSSEPLRTFHETQDSTQEPFRLSYHGKSHYNSILAVGWKQRNKFFDSQPGVVEDAAIKEYLEDKESEASYNTN